jgi:predicted Zn-ribbon and HTH transcriptional regulator
MTLDALFFAYVFVFLAALACVAIYYDFRRKRFEPTPSRDNIFRCEKCAFVYTDDADVDRSRCPQCGTINVVFRF